MIREKIGFRLVYTGRKNRKLRKTYPKLSKEFFVEIDNRNQIDYMIRVDLTDPHVKIYLQYSDGTEQRVRLYKRHFYNIVMIIKNLITYRKNR